jgi:Flp pilus assembly pilin Flp
VIFGKHAQDSLERGVSLSEQLHDHLQHEPQAYAATPREVGGSVPRVTALAGSMNSRALYAHQIHLPHLGLASSRTELRYERDERDEGGESHMTFINEIFARLQSREEGQTMAEYGVVLAVITIAAVGAFLLLGDTVDNAISSVVALLPG